MTSSARITVAGGRSVAAASNVAIRARDIMTRKIVAVQPGTTVRRIAELLSESHISAVPVTDGGKLVGIVSEGDLMHRQELGTADETSARPAKSHGMHARDVMTPHVVTVGEDTVLADVVKTMQSSHIRRVLVTRGDEPIGIISRANIMRALADRPEGSAGPSSRDDDMLRYQVIETLLSIPGTSPWATVVIVTRGVIDLRGSIEHEAVRDPSRIAIENIPGVVAVHDQRAILQPY